MSNTDVTAEEFIQNLNGFDEIAISQHWGLTLQTAGDNATMFGRALVFVHLRHNGASDVDAKQQAMDMPLGEVNTYFAEDTEIDPDEPETESGKDD